MAYTVTPARGQAFSVAADEHRLEGGWHVFRQTVTVMGRPRTVVALRVHAAEVVAVHADPPGR